MKEFYEKNTFKGVMISDRTAKIPKAYNVYIFGSTSDNVNLKTRLAIPSTFLIDNRMKILWRYLGTGKDRPSISTLAEAIDYQKKASS